MARTKKPGEKTEQEELQDDELNQEQVGEEGEEKQEGQEEVNNEGAETEQEETETEQEETETEDPPEEAPEEQVIQREPAKKSKVKEREEEAAEAKKPQQETDGKIWYKKVGGGSMRLPGRIIKPGEKVRLHPDEVPKGAKDLLIPLESIPVTAKETPIIMDVKKSEYTLKQRAENSPWWDILDAKGKVVNDKALRKEKAEEYIRDMMR